MTKTSLILLAMVVSGCASTVQKREVSDSINRELSAAAATKQGKAPAMPPPDVSASLLPPIRIDLPKSRQPIEERFNLALNNVPAAQFFMTLVNGTRYSMLVHPDVTGTISANLKDVTVFEALDAIREMYGYDYKVEGNRIYIKPLTLQTRVFHINYLTGNRKGTSDIRVTSGSVADAGGGGTTTSTASAMPTNGTAGTAGRSLESSKISTTSDSNFWAELRDSLQSIVGNKDGRSVVVSPQSGVIVVRGMWDDLKNVSDYLKATQISVDRQVILEAKILEVELSKGFQSGINWAGFRTGGNSRLSTGILPPGAVLQPQGALASGATIVDPATRAFSGAKLASNPGQDITSAPGSIVGGLFGLAFQTSNFAAMLSFLETQGAVHVLSSPRIATLNNQKAVLKVGTDEFFVTSVSTTTTATGNTSSTTPSVTVQPFFSGVALDVMPQIDDEGNVTLHVHPSVSNVTTVEKPVNLGTAGSITLPLASSAVSETDSVVRGRDGQIIAIGGLMRQSSTSDRGEVPGAGSLPVVGALFRNTDESVQKRELVILIKPTVVQSDSAWNEDITEAQKRIQAMQPPANTQ